MCYDFLFEHLNLEDSPLPADVILYGLVAAGLVFWLRGLLGTRNEDEPRRPNPFAEQQPDKSGAPAPLATAIAHDSALSGAPAAQGGAFGEEALARHMAIAEESHAGLNEIVRADHGFDAARFLTGAQDAFVMIVEAFAEGDRDTLRGLLAEPVLKGFYQALDARAARGETASVEIHAVRKAEIIRAWLEGRTAFITVRFVADETNVLKDAQGTLLHGHPDRVTETIDVWTFGRAVNARSPAWFVYETRDEDSGA